jgi:A/G-specific adenine glycosylase
MLIEPGTKNPILHKPEVIRKTRTILFRWGKLNFQDYPWRYTENKWHSLVAEILLQRTRANNVIPVYHEFIKIFPEPKDITVSSIQSIRKVIYPLGLSWRAEHLKSLGKELVMRNNEIPKELVELKKLPGVGDYVGSAWLSFHGEQRAVLIDANIVRWLCRIENEEIGPETRRKKWVRDVIEKITPKKNWKDFNFALLDFSMLICSKKPKCEVCPFSLRICSYPMRLKT